jgi:outer membrane protein assembly factor BamD (BamD/ComL family)
MRKTTFFIIILTGLLAATAAAQTKAEEKLFQEAKILLFDEKWEEAQAKLEELLVEYPRSPLAPQAIFYRAKCLGKQRGQQEKALRAYEDYLYTPDKNVSMVEEAETSIIDLAYDLYIGRGGRDYLEKIEDRLQSPSSNIRYYAALKLSQVKDKHIASRAVPVLKQMVEKEADPDYKDRAKIALMRISPDSLKGVEERADTRRSAKILKIRIEIRGQKEPELSLNIPWALADLALSAIPEKDKAALRLEGYDLDKIVDQLTGMKDNIIEIRDRENKDRVIRIWIE